MAKQEIGKFIQQSEGFKAFVPHPFPLEGGFEFSPRILKKHERANRLVGKLDGITKLLPDANFFLLMYLRKDAASSSQIEGTQATMMDAIEAGAGHTPNVPTDVDDILHYIEALGHGMQRVREEDFPVSLRLVRELHGVLMKKARTTHYPDPGEFRKSQNWIGGTKLTNARFVPPPAHELPRVLGDLENFMHANDDVLTLIKAGLIHAQFETIHPFLDGNGRTGRMLITFYLWKEAVLEKPVLFLSSFFKKHQQLYYERLSSYEKGDVEAWMAFFLDGIIEIAEDAIETVSKITALRERNILAIQQLGKRASESAATVLPRLYEQPIVTTKKVKEWTGFTTAGAGRVIDRFIDMGILKSQDKDKTYGQAYIYEEYINIFRNAEDE